MLGDQKKREKKEEEKKSKSIEKELQCKIMETYIHIVWEGAVVQIQIIEEQHVPAGIGGTVPRSCFFSNSSKRMPKNGT